MVADNPDAEALFIIDPSNDIHEVGIVRPFRL